MQQIEIPKFYGDHREIAAKRYIRKLMLHELRSSVNDSVGRIMRGESDVRNVVITARQLRARYQPTKTTDQEISREEIISKLSNIRGISTKTAWKLVENYTTIEAIRLASIDDLLSIKGISIKRAAAIRNSIDAGQI